MTYTYTYTAAQLQAQADNAEEKLPIAVASAWVNFNPTTNTINASYNVSSVTDGGTGVTDVSYLNPISNTQYSAVATTNLLLGSSNVSCTIGVQNSSGCSAVTRNASGSNVDATRISVICIGGE